MILKDWFQKFHSRPLKIAAAFLLAVWFIFAERSYVGITEKHLGATKQTADLLSLAVQSKDRIMTESLLETLISQGGAHSAALCKGSRQIVGANQDLFGCKIEVNIFDTVIINEIPGSGELVLNTKFNMLKSLSPVFSMLGFGLILVFAGFYFIQIAQSQIQKDILGPLLNKLLSNEKLEITELNDLRDGVKKAQELEAQKAVTMAIQENNQQVAHDIRSPVASINELLKMIEVKDEKIRLALEKAIVRANSVMSSLLSRERTISKDHSEPIYDVSTVLQDIATEKQPLFSEGKIEVSAPKYLFVRTALTAESLSRILSNIVDNAMLACDNTKNVKISVCRKETSIGILVADTGRGIPAEILGKIGQKGLSMRKKSEPAGTGRGVYSAQKTLNQIGGRIDFESSPEHGTKVTINIPIGKSEQLRNDLDFILIDNEEVVQTTWNIKASDAGMKIKIFSSVEELLSGVDLISKDIPIFLDSDLGNHKKGESFAANLREFGFTKLYLTTAYSELHGQSLPYVDAVIDKSFGRALAILGYSEPNGFEAGTEPDVG